MTDRATFLARRRNSLGGSDIAAALGLSPWRTPLALYLEKVGEAGDEPVGNAEAMHWGTVLEEPVARHWAEVNKATIQRINAQMVHPSHPWATANIDRAVVIPGSRARFDPRVGLLGTESILEVKTSSAFKAADWGSADDSDEVPIYYAAQAMWYLAISGLDVCEFAVLVGGQRYLQRRVERDADTIKELLERGEHFWRHHVLARIPPEPTNSADVLRLFGRDDGELRAIDNDAQLLADLNDLRAVRTQAKELETREEEIVERMKLAIGGNAGLALNGKPVVTWKAAKDSTKTDWKALAEYLGPAPSEIQQYTTTTPGSRRFIIK